MTPATVRIVNVVEDVRRHLTSRLRKVFALWIIAGIMGALILAWLAVTPEGWHQGTVIPMSIDLILVGLGVFAWKIYQRANRLWLREPNLTASMEERSEIAPGVLQGSLELSRALPLGVSSALATQATEDVLAELTESIPNLAGRLSAESGRWIRHAMIGFVSLVLIFAMLTTTSPSRSLSAWSGLVKPFGLLASPIFPPLEVKPGTADVLRGTDVLIDIKAPGRTTVVVHWKEAGDLALEERIDVIANQAELILKKIDNLTEYWIQTSDGTRSPVYELRPVDPFLVNNVIISLIFPPYLGRFPEEYGVDMPPLKIPSGSRLAIKGWANRSLSFAGLDGPQGEKSIQLSVSGRGFEGDWIPRISGVYPWRFTDTEESPAEVVPDPLEITLVPDSIPDVAVLVPGKDASLPVSQLQPLVLEATDDYGLDRLELVVYKVTAFGDRLDPEINSLKIGGAREVLLRPVMDLRNWNLLPGDTVRYFVRAVDNAPSPNVSETPEYVLRPPTLASLRREAQERLDYAVQGVEDLAKRADKQAQEVQNLERKLNNPREVDLSLLDTPKRQKSNERMEFQEQEEIRKALKDQEIVLNAIDSLEIKLAQLNRDLESMGLGDPELQRKLQELQNLMDKLAPDNRQDRSKELIERTKDMNAIEAGETLSELSADQDALRDRLEEVLETFKRAAMEQDFRAVAAEADELAQQEEALADAIAEGDDPDLRSDQQEILKKRAEELQEHLNELQERLDEAGENTARDAVDEATQQGEQAQQLMADAQLQSRMRQTQQATQSAQQAAESMSKMSQELQQAQQEMEKQEMAAFQGALQETATLALAMAREQTSLRDQMRSAGQEELSDVRGGQSALLQGVRSIADNLSARDRSSRGDDDRDVVSEIGKAMNAIEQTLTALQDQGGRIPLLLDVAGKAVGALNQVSLAAMAATQQAGQMGQSQASQQMMEQMEQLAQMQGSINNQTGQLTPMQLGEQAMAQQLKEAAERQKQVADELEGLSQKPTAQDHILGDLDAMALDAMDLANRLFDERLDSETLQRQQALFHRLLNSGRSLEKDEFSEERESFAPGDFERGIVDSLSPEDMGALRFEIPNIDMLLSLSPAQRHMVVEYFENLNRLERQYMKVDW